MATLESYVEALIAELTRIQAPGTVPGPDKEGFSFPGKLLSGTIDS